MSQDQASTPPDEATAELAALIFSEVPAVEEAGFHCWLAPSDLGPIALATKARAAVRAQVTRELRQTLADPECPQHLKAGLTLAAVMNEAASAASPARPAPAGHPEVW